MTETTENVKLFPVIEDMKEKWTRSPSPTYVFNPKDFLFAGNVPDPKSFLGAIRNTVYETGFAASVLKNIPYGGAHTAISLLMKGVWDGEKKRLKLSEVESMLNAQNLPFNENPLDFAPVYHSSIIRDDATEDILSRLGITLEAVNASRYELYLLIDKLYSLLDKIVLLDNVDYEKYDRYVDVFDRLIALDNDSQFDELYHVDDQLEYLLGLLRELVSAMDGVVPENTIEAFRSLLRAFGDRYEHDGHIWKYLYDDIRQFRIGYEDITTLDYVLDVEKLKEDNGIEGEDDFGGVFSVFPFARSRYARNGYPSVNPASTFLPFSGKDEKSVTEEPFGNIQTNIPIATPVDGQADEFQKEKPVDTKSYPNPDGSSSDSPVGGGVGPLVGDLWQQYLQTLGNRESGNNYGAVNRYGYCGRWQFGAGALIGEGYVYRGWKTGSLGNPKAWTGKDGVTSRTKWLQNTNQCQDKAMLGYTRKNYRSLLRMGVVQKTSDPAYIGGMLAVAHLLGPGGARDYKNGRNKSDANGTKASDYFNMMYRVLSGKEPPPVGGAVVNISPEANRAAVVDSHMVPDAASISMPAIGGAPQYPYNKVFASESGHIKEYDDTPGFERISERHKTGTGYEIDANGNLIQHISAGSYKAVLGSDYMIVHGTVQIVAVGDVGIKSVGDVVIDAANDLHLNVGGNMNVNVKGDWNVQVDGNAQQDVEGDLGMNVGGFMKLAVEQDLEAQGASVSIAADDTDVNIAAHENMNMAVGKNIGAVAGENITTESGANTNIFANGEAVVASKGEAVLQSQARATVSGKSQTTIHSGADLALDASSITNQVPVTKAVWASMAVVSEGHGAAPEPSVSPDSGADKEGSRSNNESRRDTSKIQKAVKNFSPIDSNKTQRGREGKAYSDGVKIA